LTLPIQNCLGLIAHAVINFLIQFLAFITGMLQALLDDDHAYVRAVDFFKRAAVFAERGAYPTDNNYIVLIAYNNLLNLVLKNIILCYRHAIVKGVN